MCKYPEVQRTVSGFIIANYDMRLMRRYCVTSYNYFYRFGICECEHMQLGQFWLLFQLVYDDDMTVKPIVHILRDYTTVQRAEIAFTALTELSERGLYYESNWYTELKRRVRR